MIKKVWSTGSHCGGHRFKSDQVYHMNKVRFSKIFSKNGLFITNSAGYPEVASGAADEEMLKRIADTLSVYPDLPLALAPHHGVKLVVCVEGLNDVAFLTAISRIAHRSDQTIIDIDMSQNVVILPLGGSVLKEWGNQNYLKKLNTREYHIYDSDNTDAHAIDCDQVNRRGDGSSARMTRKREMENYIHNDIVKKVFGVQIEIDEMIRWMFRLKFLIQLEPVIQKDIGQTL